MFVNFAWHYNQISLATPGFTTMGMPETKQVTFEYLSSS
jgi:hypothetical protein